MTVEQLQDWFKTQLDAGQTVVFYMTMQSGADGQLTGSVLKHNTESAAWEDLLASLAGYSFQEIVGSGAWPRFSKD